MFSGSTIVSKISRLVGVSVSKDLLGVRVNVSASLKLRQRTLEHRLGVGAIAGLEEGNRQVKQEIRLIFAGFARSLEKGDGVCPARVAIRGLSGEILRLGPLRMAGCQSGGKPQRFPQVLFGGAIEESLRVLKVREILLRANSSCWRRPSGCTGGPRGYWPRDLCGRLRGARRFGHSATVGLFDRCRLGFAGVL